MKNSEACNETPESSKGRDEQIALDRLEISQWIYTKVKE